MSETFDDTSFASTDDERATREAATQDGVARDSTGWPLIRTFAEPYVFGRGVPSAETLAEQQEAYKVGWAYNPTTIWYGFQRVEATDGSAVILGRMEPDNLSYVLDPRTYEPFTPGFERIHHLDGERMVVTAHGDGYVVSAADIEEARQNYLKRPFTEGEKRVLTYPMFFNGHRLRYTRVDEDTAVNFGSSVEKFNALGAMFDLEKTPSNPKVVAGQKFFRDTLAQVLSACGKDEELLEQLTSGEGGSQIELPDIDDGHLEARVSLLATQDGMDVISMVSTARSHRGGQKAFHVVQDEQGEVTFVDGSLDRSITSTDPSYQAALERSRELFGRYFTGLGVAAASEVMTGDNLHDMLRRLSSLRPKDARAQLQASLAAENDLDHLPPPPPIYWPSQFHPYVP